MKYKDRSSNEVLGILYQLIERRYNTCKKITIVQSNDNVSKYDIETDEK